MSRKERWSLILKGGRGVLVFTSKDKLHTYAKQHHFTVKRGGLSPDDHTFYTLSVDFVPGNR